MVTFDLPMPPSVNALYGNSFNGAGKGRFKMPKYKAWIAEASVALNQQRVPKIRGPFIMAATFGRPNNRRMDVCNREKALSDLLVEQGVIEDDSLMQSVTLSWDLTKTITGVRVELRNA